MKSTTKISEELSSKILTIGPDYKNQRGGVGAVIDVYSRYYEEFNFIASHRNTNSVLKVFVFLSSLVKLFSTLFSNNKIKIIHIHGASYGSFYRKYVVFLIGRYLFKKKIIYHIHGGGFKEFHENCSRVTKRLIRSLFEKADIVLCLSQSWHDYFEQNFKIKKLIILPNIIDYPVQADDVVKTDLISFLFLGLICDAKGIFDLTKVIIKNKERFRGRIKLLIGGNGEVQRLKDLIQKNQIEDIVEFLGWISSNEKARVINSCDVYILPSYNEGLPISILESMACSKAIISTNVGGIPEIVVNNENGLLIDPGDLEQIESSIDFFLDNREMIKTFGAISAQKVQKHLPHEVLKELEEIYQAVLLNE